MTGWRRRGGGREGTPENDAAGLQEQRGLDGAAAELTWIVRVCVAKARDGFLVWMGMKYSTFEALCSGWFRMVRGPIESLGSDSGCWLEADDVLVEWELGQ